MAKVLVERERQGGKTARKGRQKAHDELPKKEGIRKPYIHDRKSLNENLSPLKRFLNKAVGRPWSKVYSEICKNLKPTSTVQQHVRDHVKGYVNQNVLVEGKIVKRKQGWGKYNELYPGELYVDPKTGILRKYKRKEAKKKRVPLDKMLYAFNQFSVDNNSLVLQDGDYFKVTEKKNGEKVFQKANATHARHDALTMVYRFRFTTSTAGFLNQWEKRIRAENSEYWTTLWNDFWKHYADKEKSEAAYKKRLAEESSPSSP